MSDQSKLAESLTKMLSLHVEGNNAELKLETSRDLIANIAYAMSDILGDAPNYVEISCFHPTHRELTLTITKKYGKTPNERRLEAEEKLAKTKEQAVQLVMDLVFALREIKGKPRLTDLVKLAKRIKTL